MTWSTRLRLFFGILVIVVLVGALTIALSHRKGEATADSASVSAIDYSVGSDYGGTVVDQHVEAGDLVREGDPIATIQSNDLSRDLAEGIPVSSSDVFDINDDGTILVKSSVTGIVREVDAQAGAFATAGGAVATIADLDSLSVTAEFRLSPTDFARIYSGADALVTLPDDAELEGVVESVEATTVDGDAIAIVEVDIDESEYGNHDGLLAPGTPVAATMSLRNEDALADFVSAVRGVITDVRSALAL